MARAGVRQWIYNLHGEPLHQLSVRDLKDLQVSEQAEFVCRDCGTRDAKKPRCTGYGKQHRMSWRATLLYKQNQTSKTSLTVDDMLANCGLWRGSREDISEGRQATARNKVEAWPDARNPIYMKWQAKQVRVKGVAR